MITRSTFAEFGAIGYKQGLLLVPAQKVFFQRARHNNRLVRQPGCGILAELQNQAWNARPLFSFPVEALYCYYSFLSEQARKPREHGGAKCLIVHDVATSEACMSCT